MHLRANYSSATDSRAVCNRVRPCCSRCAKSKRPCQYGLRLSWPKATNTKRSLTHSRSIQDVIGIAKGFSQTCFVNATSWDIQLHNHLRMNQGFPPSQNLPITQLMLQRQDLIIMGDWPCKESFRRWRYHGSQSTYVMRKENFLTTVDIMLLAEFYQANTCSYLYGVLYTGCFRT